MTRRPCRWAPGAAKSGARIPLAPWAENPPRVSSVTAAVPIESVAPTAITNGSTAGLAKASIEYPEFPAAATTTIPRFQACSAA